MPQHFSNRTHFIEAARAGDTYRETPDDGLTVMTYRALSRRPTAGVLPVKRFSTDLIAQGHADYAYRTRSTLGNLFDSEDRNGDTAFLATQASPLFIDCLTVARRDHSDLALFNHHLKTLAPLLPIRTLAATAR